MSCSASMFPRFCNDHYNSLTLCISLIWKLEAIVKNYDSVHGTKLFRRGSGLKMNKSFSTGSSVRTQAEVNFED